LVFASTFVDVNEVEAPGDKAIIGSLVEAGVVVGSPPASKALTSL